MSVFFVLLPTHHGPLLKPNIQAVLLSGALPCWVVECNCVQQCADQPAHARRPHARRCPQGIAQPHQGATLFPLPLLCQQRSPERHLSSYCPQLWSRNDCGNECTRQLEGAAPFKTLLPQPQTSRAVRLFGFYLFLFICHFGVVWFEIIKRHIHILSYYSKSNVYFSTAFVMFTNVITFIYLWKAPDGL